jgi:hypothetical protein
MSRHLRGSAWIALVACVLFGCRTEEQEQPAPREVFRWTSQAVSFSPPPAGWRREGELSGGVRGVRFVKEHSVGEAITVGEFHHIAERDRTAAIQELIDNFEKIDRYDFLRDSQLAQSRTDDLFTGHERRVAEEVNAALSRSRTSYLNDDPKMARGELENALAAARRFRLTLDDVLEKAALEPLRRQEPQRFASFERRNLQVGGEPAVSFAWSFELSGRRYERREVFVVHRSHLYVARFIGLEKTVPLFERVMTSIEFPQ